MDTIAAIATAQGGAIGIIRISGEKAIEFIEPIFQGKDTLSQALPYTIHYGKIVDSSANEVEIIDQVLVSIFKAPHSFTGEDSVEISCHGSHYILQRVMELLIQHGARQARPGEFTQRAFLNKKLDLSQAEAIADLISSTNSATHRMAMSQLRGGFSNELNDIRKELLQLTTLLELELDFSGEEVEFADRTTLYALTEKIKKHLTSLTHSFHTGNAIKNGISVAIIGAPNVGKSTLLNALVHEERAIVSDIQGTTRDTIEDIIQIKGVTFRFIDTAGIRRTRDHIEKIGIERSLQAASRAQIIILLTEPGKEFPTIDIRETSKPILRVVNKADISIPLSSYLYHKETEDHLIHISALTGAGLPLLEDALVREARIPEISESSTIVTNLRHYEALSKALDSIIRVQSGLQDNIPSDLIAQDLHQCLFHLAEITGGEITSDEVLSNIFRNFCIGK